ncbi:helix-turn-helix domain-containing protein [Granulicella sp. dw_53]|uniref:helix-turn-helix domain-containing protein n=1 Tax=Granulicella sp. dw_53 TaxID=2719792 RepID=UPI001BD1E990|nr:helix-turn-helix domain-containing protein [Granulicella sp. dw_53]
MLFPWNHADEWNVELRERSEMEKTILTTSEVARLLGISVRTAQLLIEGGSLPSWKTPGGHRRVYRADIVALLTRSKPSTSISSSARVILVASAKRRLHYEKLLSEIGECFVESYDDVYSASFAVGSRLPAIVIVDLNERSEDRRSFLRKLTEDPVFSLVRIIAIGGRRDALDKLKDRPNLTRISSLGSLPDAVRAVLNDPAEITILNGNFSFPTAKNEAQRLAAVERSGLVDTVAEDSFDKLTWLASHSLGMPISVFTVLTSTHQWFKSRLGLEMEKTPRSWAFCNQTILQKHVFSVENLSLDSRFADIPAVAGQPNLRFYAGAPVIDSDGFALGSLCVIDYKPRALDQNQKRTLLTLAALASDAVQLRAITRRLQSVQDALRESNNS